VLSFFQGCQAINSLVCEKLLSGAGINIGYNTYFMHGVEEVKTNVEIAEK
jgi:hypothetical protein